MTGVYILAVHILIVVIMYVLMKAHVLEVDLFFFAIIVFIPLWGAVSALIITYLVKAKKSGSKKDALDNMSGRIEKKEIVQAPVADSENIVPLEDALIMNDPKVRREVMMDVLMQDTGSYIHVLDEARMNDDVEVVHYATTAMASLSKEYELKLQEYSVEYSDNPEKEGLLDDYINFLGQYISSGMISGQFLEIQRTTYHQLLRDKLSLKPNIDDYAILSKSLMDGGLYSDADTALLTMEKNWPNDEKLWLLRFRYYYDTGAGSKVNEMIEKTSNDGGFYSRQVRDVVKFWKAKAQG